MRFERLIHPKGGMRTNNVDINGEDRVHHVC